jgi:lipopolysaccharide export system permease protein
LTVNIFGRLDRYIFWQTFFGVLVAAGAVCLAIVLVDVVEQLRNVAGIAGAGTITALRFTLMRTPAILEQALPFAVLVGSIVTFMRLSRSSEVVAMRASGISTWRFLSPVAALALLFGIFTALILGPGASRLNAAYETQQLALTANVSVSSGPGKSTSSWTRDRGPQQHYTINYLTTAQGIYRGVTLYTFSAKDSAFVARYDAKTARRDTKAWTLSDVTESRVGAAPVSYPSAVLPLTLATVETASGNGDSAARSIPVWALPAAARSAALAGGSPQRYWLQFHRKLALPITLLAMAMIAAVLSLSSNRSGGRALMTAAAIVAGLLIYFVNDLSGALATTGLAPSWVAAWSPPLAALFIAMATVSFREDG